MTDLDLSGEIATAINEAAGHGRALVLGYVADDGTPSLSFRGSAQVYSSSQLAVWARKPDEGLAVAVAERPAVSLLYLSRDTPGARYLSIKGRARVAPEINDVVYDRMFGPERERDPDRKGVAILIDVDTIDGAGESGFFHQKR
jgi:hypothetical protein